MTSGSPLTHLAAIVALCGGVAIEPIAALAQGPDAVPAAVEAPVSPVEAPIAAPATTPAPALAEPPMPELSEVFIDRTDYSLGATERQVTTSQEDAIAAGIPTDQTPAVTVDSVGSVDVSSQGQISWADRPVSYSMAIPDTVVTPTSVTQGALEYFSRKLLRPLGRLGNENVKLIFPLAIPAPITSLFGWRTHPISGTARLHTGTDIGAAMGTPVLAALAGRVILADSMGGYGLAVALEHNSGIQQTMYAHLSEIFVKPGELIQQGTVIGRVGSTGASTGPHLHFEFRQMTQDGTWVAMDSGQQLEISLTDLARSLQVAQKPNQAIAQTPLIPMKPKP
jgi:murein DD-endopeptidase MepM/ murein hydrolase activator NlpD